MIVPWEFPAELLVRLCSVERSFFVAHVWKSNLLLLTGKMGANPQRKAEMRKCREGGRKKKRRERKREDWGKEGEEKREVRGKEKAGREGEREDEKEGKRRGREREGERGKGEGE